jgi:hypothetical protein
MATLEKMMDVENGWTQLTVPELHTWTVGEVVSGKLLSVERVSVKGKSVVQYVLHSGIISAGKDSRFKFLGTYDLTQKLTPAHRGMLVRIKYLGEDATVKKGENAMKVFDVHVKPDPRDPPTRDAGPITDDDIPF